MDQETAYQLALEAFRRTLDQGRRHIDKATMEQVRREHEQKQAKEQ